MSVSAPVINTGENGDCNPIHCKERIISYNGLSIRELFPFVNQMFQTLPHPSLFCHMTYICQLCRPENLFSPPPLQVNTPVNTLYNGICDEYKHLGYGNPHWVNEL